MREPIETSPDHRRSPSIVSALALGLWTALALAVLRGGVIWTMERLAHDVAADVARQRLAAEVSAIALGGLVLAVPCALAAALVLRAVAGRTLRLLLLAAVVAAGAAAFHAFLVGELLGDVAGRIGTDTERGRQAALALWAVALALACAVGLLSLLRARRHASRGPRRAGARLAGLAAPALLLALAPALFRTSYAGVGESMVLSEVVLDLTEHPELWEVTRRHPKAAPRAGVLCPSPDVAYNGADMPGILLPPPANLRVTLPEEAGPLWLVARAGLDMTVIAQREQQLRGHAVRFSVRVNGEPAFETAIPIERVGEFTSSEWVAVRGEEGLWLRAGSTLELETRLVGPDGAEVERPPPLTCGFGGMTLERRREAPRVPSSPEHPNVVLIVMDTQRADRLSAYGYGRETSPNVDRLAREGTLFENVYSTASWTWPSTASILTGLAPEQHGVVDEQSCYLDESLDTLAEALQRQGFTTAAFSANALIVPDKNFDQGFELFDHGKSATRQSSVFMPAALDWIDSVAGRRFFLYLHLADPHTPYMPLPEARARFAADVTSDLPESAVLDYQNELLGGCGRSATGELALDSCVPPLHRQWIRELYDACVWSGDHWVGRVLDQLEASGVADETIVVFTADHGEELFDHGFGLHGQDLHRELVQVPLVMAGPGIPRGLRVATPVSNRHVAPTLAHLGGAELRGPDDALDLVEAARAGRVPARTILYSTRNGWWNGRWRLPIYGMREGDLVLHWAPAGAPWGAPRGSAADPPDGELRLYDVAADPDEQRDLAPELSARAAELRRALSERLDALEARRASPAIPAGESTLGFLRDIGYIGEE